MGDRIPEHDGGETTIRPAASLIAVRDGEGGIEVLVLKRSAQMRFLPGFLAFPGGSIDDFDYQLAETKRYGAPLHSHQEDDAAYALGALREGAEEVGVAFAVRSEQQNSQFLQLTEQQQSDLLANRVAFSDLLLQSNLSLDLTRLRFVGRWVTPPSLSARFDTRFFVTVVKERDISLRMNEGESDWGKWCLPQTLLEDITEKRTKAAPPTKAMLRGLMGYESAEDCFNKLDVPSPPPEKLAELAKKLND